MRIDMPHLALGAQRIQHEVMSKVVDIKKASGRNVKESERNTERVSLRLDPQTAEDLRELAEQYGVAMARVVEAAVALAMRNADSEFVDDLREIADLDALESGGDE